MFPAYSVKARNRNSSFIYSYRYVILDTRVLILETRHYRLNTKLEPSGH